MNAFTVDVEDYFHVTGFEKQIAREDWPSYARRVESSTHLLLDLLSSYNVRGTFFVLGWLAQQTPSLVRAIHAAGHEIASHSHWHRLVYSLTPESFRRDLRDARAALEDAAGVSVTAFRAPSFSITERSLWALEILCEEGYTVDASIFPTRHDRYGIPGAKPEIHHWRTPSGTLIEFPSTVARVATCHVPVGGGGYFRLYPWSVSRWLLERVQQSGRPFMFYVHPWEVDVDQPRLACGSRGQRFRHYVNLATTLPKLRRLLETFRFGTVTETIAAYAAHHTLATVDTTTRVEVATEEPSIV